MELQNIQTKLALAYEGSNERTVIIALPMPDLASVKLGGSTTTNLPASAIVSDKDFAKDYGEVYTWDCFGNPDHLWSFEGYEIFTGTSFHEFVLILYYSPVNREFIENWMTV